MSLWQKTLPCLPTAVKWSSGCPAGPQAGGVCLVISPCARCPPVLRCSDLVSARCCAPLEETVLMCLKVQPSSSLRQQLPGAQHTIRWPVQGPWGTWKSSRLPDVQTHRRERLPEDCPVVLGPEASWL